MKVLGLTSYPVEAAATRYRLTQYVAPLAERGIKMDVSPFLDSRVYADFYRPGNIARKSLQMLPPLMNRFLETFATHHYDLLYVQREAMFFGPAFFEWLFKNTGRMPMVLDLDDSTYIPYTSPTYGRAGSMFKFFGKTDWLIKQSAVVTCGNNVIAEHVRELGVRTVIIPTVVDTEKFVPVKTGNTVPVIGWIGTHSTYGFLEHLFPVLQDLAKKHKFVLKIVGAGVDNVTLPGVNVENLSWNMEREIADFQSLDIGLYPLIPNESAKIDRILGKSGFKAIQYLAVGIPFVMSPLGVCAEIGDPDSTHYNAVSDKDWYNALDKLLSDANLRAEMGKNGREYSLRHFTVSEHVDLLADTFRAAGKR